MCECGSGKEFFCTKSLTSNIFARSFQAHVQSNEIFVSPSHENTTNNGRSLLLNKGKEIIINKKVYIVIYKEVPKDIWKKKVSEKEMGIE